MYATYIDESGNAGAYFVVAGITSTPKKWGVFSQEWQAVLDSSPKIECFKSSNANADLATASKLPCLIEIMNKHIERADVVVIHTDGYKRQVSGKIGATFDSPYHQGYMQVMMQAALSVSQNETPGLVNFTLDEVSLTEHLELINALKAFKESCPNPAVAAVLGEELVLGDDKKILPLQGADLYAGLMRRAYEDKNKDALRLLRSLTVPSRGFPWDEEKISELISRSARREPLFGRVYEDGKSRSQRLKEQRKLFKRPKSS